MIGSKKRKTLVRHNGWNVFAKIWNLQHIRFTSCIQKGCGKVIKMTLRCLTQKYFKTSSCGGVWFKVIFSLLLFHWSETPSKMCFAKNFFHKLYFNWWNLVFNCFYWSSKICIYCNYGGIGLLAFIVNFEQLFYSCRWLLESAAEILEKKSRF